MHSPAGRLAGVDALKALACSLIVWHHLAFYGPMSDVVHAAAPAVIDRQSAPSWPLWPCGGVLRASR